jgi:hypothetical protein
VLKTDGHAQLVKHFDSAVLYPEPYCYLTLHPSPRLNLLDKQVSVYVVNNSFSPELREDQVRNIDEYSKFCIDIKIETMENIEAGVLLVGKVTDVKNLGNEGDTLIYHQDTFNYTKPL